MEWNKLMRVNEAPQHGWMLAYLREKILFERYSSLEEVKEHIKQGELLELHLFNQEKEYRVIASQSKRYLSGVVETIADFRLDKETTFDEEVYLETKYQKLGAKIHIYNHLKYDENGTLEIDNYRLAMKEG